MLLFLKTRYIYLVYKYINYIHLDIGFLNPSSMLSKFINLFNAKCIFIFNRLTKNDYQLIEMFVIPANALKIS